MTARYQAYEAWRWSPHALCCIVLPTMFRACQVWRWYAHAQLYCKIYQVPGMTGKAMEPT